MHTTLKLISPIIVLSVTACASVPGPQSSRFEGAPLSFAAQPAQMDVQAQALTDLSERIVVQTTMKGAGIGAAVGCGIAAVAAGNAANCVTAAAVGAASGALVGHLTGELEVDRRIEHISPSAVVRTLRKTNAKMEEVRTSLPARLAAQEELLSRLDLERATGALSPEKYATARALIAQERRALAAALIETESHANQATANLRKAQSEGQTGLDWHIGATSKLAIDAHSARSSISLL